MREVWTEGKRSGELTWIRVVGQQARAADADREEIWGLVLPLVAVLRGALPADRLARPVLRVGEPPDGEGSFIVQAQLLWRAVKSRLWGQRRRKSRLESRAEIIKGLWAFREMAAAGETLTRLKWRCHSQLHIFKGILEVSNVAPAETKQHSQRSQFGPKLQQCRVNCLYAITSSEIKNATYQIVLNKTKPLCTEGF